MTLLATDDRAWGKESFGDDARTTTTDSAFASSDFKLTRNNGTKHSRKEPKAQTSSVRTKPEQKHTKRIHPITPGPVPMEITTSRLSEVSTVPIEISWQAPPRLPPKQKHERSKSESAMMIPNEISFHSSSSSSVVSDLESEELPRTRRSPTNTRGDDRQRDFFNKCLCLELLESKLFDDNCVGMEHLVSICNHELVNSSRLYLSEYWKNENITKKKDNGSSLSSSIAYSLVFGDNTNEKFSKRLRAVFPSFLCPFHQSKIGSIKYDQKGENSETDGTASLSSSSSSSSRSSSTPTTSNRRIDKHDGEFWSGEPKTSLKLPALRILVSSLELVSRTRACRASSSRSSSHSMDLLTGFWRLVLAYMTECLRGLEVLSKEGSREDLLQGNDPIEYRCRDGVTSTPSSSCISSSIEAALVVKIFRLLHKLQPEVMSPYVRYSLLPYISNAREYGCDGQLPCHHPSPTKGGRHRRQSSGDKMLVRECERLLKSFL